MLAFFLAASSFLVIGSDAINGGKNASIWNFPYHVTIEERKTQCQGAIVNKNWILTLGHACAWYSPKELIVRAGSDRRRKGGSVHHVDRIIRHEKYRGYEQYHELPINDISLMHVVEPFLFDETRQPIQLFNATEKLLPGKMAKVSGFGHDKDGSEKLLSVEVPVIELALCNNTYTWYFQKLPEGKVCAGYYKEDTKNACYGDWGSPLVVNNKLAGIVSYIPHCGKHQLPVVYTKIGYHREWIDHTIKTYDRNILKNIKTVYSKLETVLMPYKDCILSK